MWTLVSMLIRWGAAKVMQRGVILGLAGGVVTEITLDELRQQAVKIAPGSDAAALEQAARTAASLLGLQGSEILWPTHTRGATAGEPIVPRYLTIDLSRGRGWYSSRHVSAKAVRRARSFGSRRGFGRGARMATQQAAAFTRG